VAFFPFSTNAVPCAKSRGSKKMRDLAVLAAFSEAPLLTQLSSPERFGRLQAIDRPFFVCCARKSW
jgi:hypothetical protein